MQKTLILLPGDCLFENHPFETDPETIFFMKEDITLCTRFRYHQQKIVLFLASMRRHAARLKDLGYKVHYIKIDENKGETYFESLLGIVREKGITRIESYEISDRFFREELMYCCSQNNLELRFTKNPSFLHDGQSFREYLKTSKPFQHTWYIRERKRLAILTESSGSPEGKKWSFDSENRKSLPAKISLPVNIGFEPCTTTSDVIGEVQRLFSAHPGNASDFRWATSPEQAKNAFGKFLEERLYHFGPYEDAIHDKEAFLFHSAISPLMNLGLITPAYVIEEVLQAYREDKCSLPTAEGFIRQVLGWREFIKGCYENLDFSKNYFGHYRRLKPCWYEGNTGIKPIDDSIAKAIRFGYTHHIERLMILGNAMLLCRVNPEEVYRWFMEMFIDSADWVMLPNVFGMSQFADGGQFATKPYIGGSNYILKMSNYPKGADWCDTFDGLYWKFISDHRDIFAGNVRTAMMVKNLDRLDLDRKSRIFAKANAFIMLTTSD